MLKIKEIKRIQEEVVKLDQQQAVLDTIITGPMCWRIIQMLSKIINDYIWLKKITTGLPIKEITPAMPM